VERKSGKEVHPYSLEELGQEHPESETTFKGSLFIKE
jgi:hypothetical protein